jgi:hypothetical protein
LRWLLPQEAERYCAISSIAVDSCRHGGQVPRVGQRGTAVRATIAGVFKYLLVLPDGSPPDPAVFNDSNTALASRRGANGRQRPALASSA